MFERTKRDAEANGASLRDVVMATNYWLTPAARDRLREARPDYFDRHRPGRVWRILLVCGGSSRHSSDGFVVAVRR